MDFGAADTIRRMTPTGLLTRYDPEERAGVLDVTGMTFGPILAGNGPALHRIASRDVRVVAATRRTDAVPGRTP